MLLLINSKQNQGIALLETASPQQVIDLVKIIYNLNANRHLLQPKSKNILSKSRNVIKKLTQKKVSQIAKYRIIRNNAKSIFQLLSSSRSLLTKVLQQ